MANKRMFSLSVCDSDVFLEMPMSSQALYFHLNLRADDDGFVNNPKKIQRLVGASEDDLKLLIAKSFVIAFESGVIVIKHWRMHNTLSANRYTETTYLEEKSMLKLKDNKAYSLNEGESLNDEHLIEMSKRLSKKQLENRKSNFDEQVTNTDKKRIDKKRIDKCSSRSDTYFGELERLLTQ